MKNLHLKEQNSEAPSEHRDAVIARVRVMCDLFNLAFEMKSLELERRNPTANPGWIKQETLRLIELGSR